VVPLLYIYVLLFISQDCSILAALIVYEATYQYFPLGSLFLAS